MVSVLFVLFGLFACGFRSIRSIYFVICSILIKLIVKIQNFCPFVKSKITVSLILYSHFPSVSVTFLHFPSVFFIFCQFPSFSVVFCQFPSVSVSFLRFLLFSVSFLRFLSVFCRFLSVSFGFC